MAEQVWGVLGATRPEDVLLPSPKKAKIDSAIRSWVGNAGIVHVTVWNQQGTVVFQDDAQSPGSTVPPSPLFARALAGELQWERTSGPGPAGLDVFIPVRPKDGASPIAVYQMLYDLKELAPALNRVKVSVALSVVLGVMSLYAVLFSIVRRASHDLERQQSMLRGTYVGMIQSLINALDIRDMAIAHHSSRVSEMAVAIARQMGLSETDIHEVEVAAFLHDVGKIGIPDDVLLKPGPLTHEERTLMELHATLGYDILAPVPISKGVKLAVRYSHERWDGFGYPDGLAGEQIPIAARVVFVADAYEALISRRPYRIARSPQQALEEIQRNAGTQFDPKVVIAFLQVWHQAQAKVAEAVLEDAARGANEVRETPYPAQQTGKEAMST